MLTQLKKGTLELCVLALLSQRDRYGYELVSLLSAEIEVTAGTIYPLLKRIKEEGYLTTEVRDSTDGPSRKYYALTGSGRAALAETLRQWETFSEKMNHILKEAML